MAENRGKFVDNIVDLPDEPFIDVQSSQTTEKNRSEPSEAESDANYGSFGDCVW